MSSLIAPTTKVISFGIWETLIHDNKSFTPVRMRVIKTQLKLSSSVDALSAAYRRTDKYYNHLTESNGLNYGPSDRLELMLRDLGESDRMPGWEMLEELLVQIAYSRIIPAYSASLIEADLLETLKRLKEHGYRLALLSNAGFERAKDIRPLLEHLGILQQVEHALFSSDAGFAMPNPDIFQLLADNMRVTTSEVLHGGNSKNTDYRAIDAGCSALVYAPQHSDLPHIQSIPELLAR